MNTDKILVKNAVFYAYHGATQDQINQGQRFIIDAEVEVDLSKACKEDDISGCLDCREVYDILKRVTTERRYNLMQVLALDIIGEIHAAHPEVKSVTIGACKAMCPYYRDVKNVVGGGGFIIDGRSGVTITRTFE
ncbi:MAG: dihydroneopterin aldolase [Eubacteriaceae bacterium]|nr:dihydroneopterin aldolase [Eubacteriaceae bacterium]